PLPPIAPLLPYTTLVRSPRHRSQVRRRRLPPQGRHALLKRGTVPLFERAGKQGLSLFSVRRQATSNCSITHCSSSAPWIHSCIQDRKSTRLNSSHVKSSY